MCLHFDQQNNDDDRCLQSDSEYLKPTIVWHSDYTGREYTEDKMSDSSDSEVPDLVHSSSDEAEPEKTNADYVDIWLGKNERFRQKQENAIKVFALGPFLYALKDVVPHSWMAMVRKGGLLLNNTRENELTGLTWDEWKLVDMLEDVTNYLMRKLCKRNLLTVALDVIDDIDALEMEELSFVDSFPIAAKHRKFIDLWVRALKLNSSKTLENETKCAVLFVCKIYHMVVLGSARDSKDIVEEKKRSWKSKDGTNPMKYKDAGNEQYQHGKFETAIDYYTKAAKSDPFNHIFFGNRAQTYNKLKRYREALADGRRAVALKPDWPKGHYRYAQAFFELDKLDEAILVNKKGFELCQKSKNLSDNNMRDLEQQGKLYRIRKDERCVDAKLRQIWSNGNSGITDPDLPQDLQNLPDKCVINVSRAMEAVKQDDDVPALVSESSSSSDDEDGHDIIIDMKHTSSGGKDNKAKKNNRKKGKQDIKKSSVSNQLPTKTDDIKVAEDMVKTPIMETPQNKANEVKKEEKAAVIEKPAAPLKKPEISEFERLLSDGLTASRNGTSVKAMGDYQKVLDLTLQFGQQHFGLDNKAIVSLKYVCASMAIDTRVYKNIVDGMEKFNDIIRSHDDSRFPLAHYGLAKAYISLNRFREALDPLKKALKITHNSKLVGLHWPGTTEKLEESVHQPFVKLVKDLMLSSRFPPPSDAKCRFHSDNEDSRTWIYLSDPDFKGFVRVLCNEQCIIEYHNHCWKVYKCKFGDLDKVADKEMLDTRCPTPECSAYIIKIFIFKQDAVVKEIVSERKTTKPALMKKPTQKTPASSVYKIQRKQEKKELRQKRKQELKEEKDDLLEDIDDIIAPSSVKSSEDKKNTEITITPTAGVTDGAESSEVVEDKRKPENTCLLKRLEEDNLDKYKVTKKTKVKKRKEKEKVKQVLAVDINFSDDKQLVSEYTQEEDEAAGKKRQHVGYHSQPFSVPTGLQRDVQEFERSYASQQPQHDDITQNMFSFFEDLLSAEGPLHVEDVKITSLLDDFPQDAKDKIAKAGGLCKFLQLSVKFAMRDDVVCLLKDAGKARDISQEHRKLNPSAVEFEPSTQNIWETNKSNRPVVKMPGEVVSREGSADKSGSIDSLDKFSLHSPVKHVKPRIDNSVVSSMDSIDDITYYPKVSVKKHAGGLDTAEERYFSDNESNRSYTSDSVSSRSEDNSKAQEDSSSSKTDDLPASMKMTSSRYGDEDILNISRSSSRSDISSEITSETKSYSDSNKLDVESMMKGAYQAPIGTPIQKESPAASQLMSRAYKSPGSDPWASPVPPPLIPPSVSQPWATRPLQTDVKKGFGPIGSPISPVGGEKVKVVRPMPRPHGSGQTLQDEVSMAAERHEKQVDQQFVTELADEVMKQMFENKPSVSDNVKRETYQRVTRDIWEDFSKSGSPSLGNVSVESGITSNNIWSSNVTSTSWNTSQSSKKSFAEQFMKNHYEKKTVFSEPSRLNENTVNHQKTMNTSYIPSSITNSIWTSNRDDAINSGFVNTSIPQPLSLPGQGKHGPIGGPSLWSTQVPSLSTKPFSPLKDQPSAGVARNVVTCAVQTCVETRCVETMTDPYSPFKEDFIKAKEERDELQTQLHTASLQLQELSNMLQEREHHCKLLEAEIVKRGNIIETKHLEYEENQKLLTNQVGKTQAELQQAKQIHVELQQRCNIAEMKLLEVESSGLQDREALRQIQQEKDRALSNANEYRISMENEVERAKSAEIKLLKEQRNAAMKMLKHSLKEAGYHMENLAAFHKKFQDEKKTVPSQLKQMLEHHQNIFMKCEETVKRLEHEFEEQIQQIKNGRKLSDLPIIHIPPPPPPPPRPQLAIQGALTGSGQARALPPSPGRTQELYPLTMPSLYDKSSEETELPTPPKPLVPPGGLPPKPLAPPPGVQPKPLTRPFGPMPPRPLIGSRPPLISAAVKPTTIRTAPKNSFEKLIERMHIIFPKYNRAMFTRLIQELRHLRGGSLSGTTMDEIIQQVSELIMKIEKQHPNSAMSLAEEAPKALAPPPGLGNVWGSSGGRVDSSSQGEIFEEEEDPCVICHEEMATETMATLDCGHRFHDECIRKWLREQSTCPNCRIHALLPDEFPTLK